MWSKLFYIDAKDFRSHCVLQNIFFKDGDSKQE